MTSTSLHDAWSAGDSYDAYMGRWSRQVAPRFLDWLGAKKYLDWLEVGCGTGALSSAILTQCDAKSLIGVDPSEGFIAQARDNVPDARAEFQLGDAQNLPFEDSSRDVIASALVLNFVPDKQKALTEMRRVARPGGVVAFYVWDYPGGGVEFMREFWNAAIALDPSASDLAEKKRFPFCTLDGMTQLARDAGLDSIETTGIEVPTIFQNFADYWRPFTLGAGPAPGYCVSLEPEARQLLHDKLRDALSYGEDGSIALKARAWAIKGTAA